MTCKDRTRKIPSAVNTLLAVLVGLAMAALYVYVCVISYKAVSARAFTGLIPMVPLAAVYVGMAWALGRLTVGFKKVMIATLVVTAVWVLSYAALPKLFRYLVKFFPVKKKSRLSRLVTPTRIACFVLLVTEVLLCLAARSGALKKRTCLIPVCLLAVYFAVYCCAACNVPQSLKSIKASEFISWWSGNALTLELVMLAIVAVYTVIYGVTQCRKAREELFTDSDLMLMQSFDRYRVVGYYLLKAKMQGVLEFSVQETEDGNRIHTVKAADISPEERAAYCAREPQVAKILDYLDSKKDDAPTDIYSLERDVRVQIAFEKEGGFRVERTLAHISTVSAVATLICGALVWLTGFLKYVMCIYLNTTVQDLAFHVAVGTPGFFLVLGFFTMVMAHIIWDLTFKYPLVKHKAAGFTDVRALFLEADTAEVPLDEEKLARLLRAYALFCHSAEGNKYWQTRTTGADSDTSMLMSEIQHIARQNAAEEDDASAQ